MLPLIRHHVSLTQFPHLQDATIPTCIGFPSALAALECCARTLAQAGYPVPGGFPDNWELCLLVFLPCGFSWHQLCSVGSKGLASCLHMMWIRNQMTVEKRWLKEAENQLSRCRAHIPYATFCESHCLFLNLCLTCKAEAWITTCLYYIPSKPSALSISLENKRDAWV